MEKEPKRYECLSCGFKSKRSKTVELGAFGFAACFKCRGRVKETDEWQLWYHENMSWARK